MSRILVTGGAGFVGSHLCEKLVQLGNEVISLDNYSTGSMDNHVKGVDYIHEDTKNILDLFLPQIDIVYHLGEYSRVEQSFEDILKTWEYNMLGTAAVLEFVKETNVRLVYAGSSTKFAENGANLSPYAFSKASNTQLVKNYHEWYGINYAITYFYNVYGDREIADGKYATLIAKYKNLCKNNEPLPVVLPGSQRRNFTHVEDIVSGLILVGEFGFGDGYGLGSPESFSVQEIAEMFGGEINYLPERKGNRMLADVVSEKTIELGWEPKHSVLDYINDFKVRGN